MCLVDPSQQSAASLAGLIEECLKTAKEYLMRGYGYPVPSGRLPIYVDGEEWKPVAQILVDRYNTDKGSIEGASINPVP